MWFISVLATRSFDATAIGETRAVRGRRGPGSTTIPERGDGAGGASGRDYGLLSGDAVLAEVERKSLENLAASCRTGRSRSRWRA